MKYFLFCTKSLLTIAFIILFLLYSKYQILDTFVFAQSSMSNDFYIIRMGNLNSGAGKPTGSGYQLNITLGQTGPGLYSGTNYKVRAGFQYISSIIPFSFTISSILIDFGDLTPTNPVTRTNTLSIDNQSASGYTVKAFENHQLLIPGTGSTIPDTTCDGGTCTYTTASPWTSSLVYGFGYRCDIVDATNYCNSDFSTSTNYKQFADLSLSETAQTVMSGMTGRDQRAQVTYKVNISAVQEAGLYSNVITYIATPTY